MKHSCHIYILVIVYLGSLLIPSVYSEPKIYLFIPVEAYTQSKVLPFALSGIEAQDYPKSRISVHISFDFYKEFLDVRDNLGNEYIRKNKVTYDQIRTWIESNKEVYHDIHLEITSLKVSADEPEIHRKSGFQNLSESMNRALKRAKTHGTDYILFMDANLVLVNDSVLKILIETQCPEVTHINNNDSLSKSSSNQGTIQDVTQSRLIRAEVNIQLTRDLGQFCILTDPKLFSRNGLIPTEVLINLPGFIHPSEENDTLVYSKGGFAWGYLLGRDDGQKLEEMDLNLIDLELKASVKGLMFPKSESMKSFIVRPEKDKLGVDHVYIINLARRADRRAAMEKRMEILGIDAEFWKATDGETLKNNMTQLGRIHILDEAIKYGKSMTYGEIGCFLSHYGVWENSLERGFESTIVFEDDITFAHNFKYEWAQRLESLRSYEAVHGPYDIVLLGRKAMLRQNDTPTEFPGLIKPGFSYCLHGYLIKQTGIEKIMAIRPLQKMIQVDLLVPILSGQLECQDPVCASILSKYPTQVLETLSVEPLLVLQSFKLHEPGHTSDTRKSEKIHSADIIRMNLRDKN